MQTIPTQFIDDILTITRTMKMNIMKLTIQIVNYAILDMILIIR